MTVRFGHHGLDVPGARATQPPACPTQPASRPYLQIPAGRLKEEASPVVLGTRHRHELPQSLLPLRHFRPCAPQTAPVVPAQPQPLRRVPPAGGSGPAERRPPAGPASRGASGKAFRAGKATAPRPLAAVAQSGSPTAGVGAGRGGFETWEQIECRMAEGVN